MTKSIWTGTCAAIVGFATTAMIAQAPQTPQTPPTPPQAPQAAAASAEGKVTVTGCLKTAPPDAASATGTAGTTGTTGTTSAASPNAAADAKFLLTEATSTPAASDPSAAPAPPPAAPSETHAGSTYRLIANPSALTPHVGKKLALTGTIEKSPAAEASSTPGTPTGADAPMLALRVESGKILAETCTGQQ